MRRLGTADESAVRIIRRQASVGAGIGGSAPRILKSTSLLQLEPLDRRAEGVGLPAQFLGAGGGFLRVGGVELRDLVIRRMEDRLSA